MKPTGSPPTWTSSLPVAGFFQTISDECSARVIVILMSGPSGVMTPPLFMRGASSAGSRPRATRVLASPAGPHTGALFFLASAGASPRWSGCACVTRIRSTLPSASRLFHCGGVFGFWVRNGSMTMTLPLTLVMRVADCPSHSTSILPDCADVLGAVAASVSAARSRAHAAGHREPCRISEPPRGDPGTAWHRSCHTVPQIITTVEGVHGDHREIDRHRGARANRVQAVDAVGVVATLHVSRARSL